MSDRLEARLTITPEVIEAIAARAAEIVVERLEQAKIPESPWMSVAEAAAFLRCDRKRIYDLRSSGRLGRYTDGGRALVLRSELERLTS